MSKAFDRSRNVVSTASSVDRPVLNPNWTYLKYLDLSWNIQTENAENNGTTPAFMSSLTSLFNAMTI